jgi:hypothetical protein
MRRLWAVAMLGVACSTTDPAASVSASIGVDGGSVTLALPADDAQGATELTLDVPPGALPEDVTVRLTALPREDALLAVRFEPAGLDLAAPVTLTFSGSGALPEDARFQWALSDGVVSVPGDVSGSILTSSLFYVGAPSGGGSALARAPGAAGAGGGSPTGTELRVQRVSCNEAVLAATEIIARDAALLEDTDELSRALTEIAAMQEVCDKVRVAEMEALACEKLDSVSQAADVVAVESVEQFQGMLRRVVYAWANAQYAGDCESATPQDVLDRKFEQVIAFMKADATHFEDDLDLTLRTVTEYVELDAICRFSGVSDSSCNLNAKALIPDVLDALREGAWEQCQARGAGFAMAGMVAEARRPDGEDLVNGYAHFSVEDLMRDAGRCAADLIATSWSDPSGVPSQYNQVGIRAFPGVNQGSFEVTLHAEASGSVTIGGQLPAAPCADGSMSAERLVARVDGARVADAGLANGGFTVSTSPFDLRVDAMLQAAGLSAATSSFDLVLTREGTSCTGDIPPLPVATIHVKLDDVAPCLSFDVSAFSDRNAASNRVTGYIDDGSFMGHLEEQTSTAYPAASVRASGFTPARDPFSYEATATSTRTSHRVSTVATGGSYQPWMIVTASAVISESRVVAVLSGTGTAHVRAVVLASGRGSDPTPDPGDYGSWRGVYGWSMGQASNLPPDGGSEGDAEQDELPDFTNETVVVEGDITFNAVFGPEPLTWNWSTRCGGNGEFSSELIELSVSVSSCTP